jgi:lipopolysaccharide/colanic/teichoic acid biosynthesis glycosyltransferase
MRSVYRYESASMALGDIAIFVVSLWLSLWLRYLHFTSTALFKAHLYAFVPVFVLWICLYVLGGLYDRHLRFARSKLFGKLWMAQTINVIVAFLYFYLLKTSSIANGLTPKTILLLYLIISGILITFWRVYLYSKITELRPLRVLLAGHGPDFERMVGASEKLRQSGIEIIPMRSVAELESFINNETEKTAEKTTEKEKTNAPVHMPVDIVVTNSFDPAFKDATVRVYDLLFKGVVYVDFSDFYEEVFEMIPLQAIDESWFLRYVSVRRRYIYDTLKRLMDIVIALPVVIVSTLYYPFVILARKIENLGPIWAMQTRIGENGRPIRIFKFASMTVSDAGKVIVQNDNRITPVGAFIRKTRLDEFPQLWTVVFGSQSLIGPRPEMPNLVEFYEKEIPHYNMRHIIKPGLSGWAQIHHDVPPQTVEATKVKLAYDLYYIKNRSLMLDLKIAFATLKTLLSRTGL